MVAYNAIYDTEPIRLPASFYRWALGLAQARPGHRLLDVACGMGDVVDLASKGGVVAVGIDLAETALAARLTEGLRGDSCVANGEALPFADASFDRLLSLGSLEHYENPGRGAGEMARVLRPRGRAVVLVPNIFGYLHVLYVWRHGTVYDDGQPLQRYGTETEWRRLLEANGLRVMQVAKFQRPLPRTWGDFWWYAHRPRKLLQALVTPLLPVNGANSFVFICEPSGRSC